MVNYYYSVEGDDNIYLNNYSKRVGLLSHCGHGFCVQTLNFSTGRYNLVEGQTSVNICKGLEFRHTGVEYNVCRGMRTYGEGEAADEAGGVRIRDKSNYNIVENSYFSAASNAIAIAFEDSSETGASMGSFNIIRNNIVDGVGYGIVVSNDNDGQSLGQGNLFYNNTFFNVSYVFSGYIGDYLFTDSVFTNNLIVGGTEWMEGNSNVLSGYSIETNGFYDNSFEPAGENPIADDPLFVAPGSGDFSLSEDSPLSLTEGGLTLTEIRYDYAGVERTPPYSIGAREL